MDGDSDALDEQADRWLVDKVRRGDTDAYEVLIRRHRDRIYRIALRMLGNPHDAEDIAQDVSIQLWTAVAGFAGSAAFTTWLYRIVVNRCHNHTRRRARTRPVLDTDPAPARGAEDTAIEREQNAAALRAVAALPSPLRAVLVLVQMEGLSYRETAAITGESEATVRGRLHRARKQMIHDMRSWS